MKVQQIVVVAVLLMSSAMNQPYTGTRATQGSRAKSTYKGAIANKDINMMTPAEIVRLKYNDLNKDQKGTLWFVAIYSGLGGNRSAAQQVIDAAQSKPLDWAKEQAEAQKNGLSYVIARHTPLPEDEEIMVEEEVVGPVFGPKTEAQHFGTLGSRPAYKQLDKPQIDITQEEPAEGELAIGELFD